MERREGRKVDESGRTGRKSNQRECHPAKQAGNASAAAELKTPSILLEVKPPTGEPYAGNPPVRFGGRGSCGSPYPYPHCTPPSIPPAKPTFLKKEKTMSQRITKIALLALVILVPCLGAVAQGKSG